MPDDYDHSLDEMYDSSESYQRALRDIRREAIMPPEQLRGTGHFTQSPEQDVLGRRLEAANESGKHLWVMAVAWRVADPSAASRGQNVIMDAENILQMQGPGCFKCERPYSAAMAKRPCLGSIFAEEPR